MGNTSHDLTGELREITAALLDVERNLYTLHHEVRRLKDVYLKAAKDFRPLQENIGDGEIMTETGIAISPTMAAMCVDDNSRTIQFIRGANTAIRERRDREPGRPVRLLYVGCGPFAALVTPLLSIYSPSELTVRLVDISKKSLDTARTVIGSLGLSESVTKFENADANDLDIADQERPDVILLEILRATLKAEPQVAVSRTLMSRWPTSLLVPEQIDIRLTLVNVAREFAFDGAELKLDRIELGTVFTLSRDSIAAWIECGDEQLPAATVKLPEYDENRYTPRLFTDISVFGEHRLSNRDSGLTIPKPLGRHGEFGPGDTVRFRYILGNEPHLSAEKVTSGLE